MKLNLDCVRSILLAVEEKPFNQTYSLNVLCGKIPNFSRDEIHYCCLMLYEAEFLELITFPMIRSNVPGIKSICELTFAGHEFLEGIRPKNQFNKIKEYCQKTGSFSFGFIADISKEFLKDSIHQIVSS